MEKVLSLYLVRFAQFVFSIRQVLEGDAYESHLGAVFEENSNIPIFAGRDRGVGSGAFFEALLMGPGSPMVVADRKDEVLPAFLTVRVDEQKTILRIPILFGGINERFGIATGVRQVGFFCAHPGFALVGRAVNVSITRAVYAGVDHPGPVTQFDEL